MDLSVHLFKLKKSTLWRISFASLCFILSSISSVSEVSEIPPPTVHGSFLVIIPDFECSGLVDPALVRTEPALVWGGTSNLGAKEIFARLRTPNLLLPREPDLHSIITPWLPLIKALTRPQAAFPSFFPYQKGKDLFLFQYDWRRNIGTELSLQLQIALDDFADQHRTASKEEGDRSSMIIVAHGMGGLLIRSLIGQNPKIAEKIEKLYLVGVPHLGTPEALARLLSGVGFYNREAALLSPEARSMARLSSLSFPSLYQMLPLGELHWVKNYPKTPSRRVAPDDLLKTGEWEEVWPSAQEEKKYYIDPWQKNLMNGYQEPQEGKNWEFCQDPSLLALQSLLAQVRDWRISLGTLGYTRQLMTRPGEKPRLLIVAGKGVKTPLGYQSEGVGLQTQIRPLYAPDLDGDGVVSLESALESNPSELTLLLKGTTHEKLLEDPLFLREILCLKE